MIQGFVDELAKLAFTLPELGLATAYAGGSGAIGGAIGAGEGNRMKGALIGAPAGLAGGLAGGLTAGMMPDTTHGAIQAIPALGGPPLAGYAAGKLVRGKPEEKTAAPANAGFLRRNAKPLALMAAGAGLHSVGQQAWGDYSTGRMIRKQNEAASSGMF